MGWQNLVIESIRCIFGDLCEPYQYADDRLERISIIACSQVFQECDFDNQYILDISLATLSPDPSLTNPIDISVIALIALKACLLIVQAELKKAAQNSGITIKDGPSSISTNTLMIGYLAVVKQYSDDYAYLKMNYKIMNASNNSQAIMTPFTVAKIYGNLSPISY